MMLRAYMDHNASTPVRPEVLTAMLEVYQDGFGNASSIHRAGQGARGRVEQARVYVASLLNASPNEIVFTSGGTESNNLAIAGTLAPHPGGHVITSTVEHSSVLHTIREMESRGWPVTYLNVSTEGVVDPEELRRALRPETRLVTIMVANNETGVLQRIPELAAVVKSAPGVRFHVDAVQAAAKIPLDVQQLGCDLLSISGHKIGAPQGSGALYVRRGVRLQPLLYGGHHERDRRAGTENVAGIVGLGEAARLAQLELPAEGPHLAALRDRLEQGMLAAVPETRVSGAGAPRVPNTTNIRFHGVEGEALVIALDLQGFCVSTGAACSSGAIEPSHVLTAMGMSFSDARSCLRFSLGKSSSEAEVDALLQVAPEAVTRLRALAGAFAPQGGRL